MTQDNQGQKTPGVDGIAARTPPERLALVAHLQLDGAAAPVRRVYIPKPGTREQRPVGLPSIVDRVQQRRVKPALEAEGDARFEPKSDGFRPGRKTWDAIGAISVQIKQQPKGVLAADIAQGCDRIAHDARLRQLNAPPTRSRPIKSWLKAGVLDKGDWSPTDTGTPHGGPASPLFANVALHGREERIQQAFPGRRAPAVLRYADDLVV